MTAAEVADQALTRLDEAEAALGHELEQHGIVPEIEEEDAPELDLSVGQGLYTTDRSRCS